MFLQVGLQEILRQLNKDFEDVHETETMPDGEIYEVRMNSEGAHVRHDP